MPLPMLRPLCVGALFAALAACTGTPAPTTSTVSGQIDQASFPTAVSQVTLKSDTGSIVSLPVDAEGRFVATLKAGATYQFLIDGETGAPIVVHATQSRLDSTVHVRSGGANVSLGRIQYVQGMSSLGVPVPAALLPISNPPATCAADEDNDTDKHHDEHGDDGEHHDEHGSQNAKGDSGHADSAAEQTDCKDSDSMGLPEHNLPDEIGCGEEEHAHHCDRDGDHQHQGAE